MINLQEFIDGFKKCEIQLGDKVWVFREPKICDINLWFLEMLEKYCIQGEYKEFKNILDNELPITKQKEVIELIVKELGLG